MGPRDQQNSSRGDRNRWEDVRRSRDQAADKKSSSLSECLSRGPLTTRSTIEQIPVSVSSPALATWYIQEYIGVTKGQGRGFSCRGDAFRTCCQWQLQLSSSATSSRSCSPVSMGNTALFMRKQGEREKTCPRHLSGLGNVRGTDQNRRASGYLQEAHPDGQTKRAAASRSGLPPLDVQSSLPGHYNVERFDA
jgi:hypothetical protein